MKDFYSMIGLLITSGILIIFCIWVLKPYLEFVGLDSTVGMGLLGLCVGIFGLGIFLGLLKGVQIK